MQPNENAVCTDTERLKSDWTEQVKLNENYNDCNDEKFILLSELNDMWDGPLDRASMLTYWINLTSPNVETIHSSPYHAERHACEFEQDKIDKTQKVNVIKPSQTEWAAPIKIAPQKHEALRICFDYLEFNAVVGRDSYPLPSTDECTESFGDAPVFPTPEASSGSCIREVDNGDPDKMAFTSHHGLSLFISMPFRLSNEPGTFQHEMDVIFSTFERKFAHVCLDEIIAYCKSALEQVEHVHKALHIL